jgi:hypothetical protein
MKIITLITALLFAVLVIAGCQSNGTTNSNSAAKNAPAASPGGANSSSTAPAKSPAEATFPPSTLKPEDVSADKPVPAEDLRNAVLAWENREVAVIGYPNFPRIMGSSISLRGSADAPREIKSIVVECGSRQQFENQDVAEDTPVVVKGIIRGYAYMDTPNPNVSLQDCQIVSKGDFSGEKGTANPGTIDTNKPISAADLHKDYYKWQGKQVAVVGNYNGHTKSSATDGKTLSIRIDVQNPKYETVVECYVSGEPGADDFKERNNRIFKGVVNGSSSKRVTLKPCEYVKK